MNLHKATYYTSGVISLAAIFLVALIINGNNNFLDILLSIAYATLVLIISALLVPLILKSINKQNNKLVKIILLLLSVTSVFYFTFGNELALDFSKVEETKVEIVKVEETKVEETKAEETKVEKVKVEEAKVEETKAEYK